MSEALHKWDLMELMGLQLCDCIVCLRPLSLPARTFSEPRFRYKVLCHSSSLLLLSTVYRITLKFVSLAALFTASECRTPWVYYIHTY